MSDNIRSMTAFSKAEFESQSFRINVEIKSVNHRFLDINFKIPQLYWALENNLRSIISKFLTRGHLDVVITRENLGNDEKRLELDRGLLESYLTLYEEVFETYLSTSITPATLQEILNKKDVISGKDIAIDENEKNRVFETVEQVLKALLEMKQTEGKSLEKDLKNRFKKIQMYKNEIYNYVNENAIKNSYAEKLKSRLDTFTKDLKINLNEDRIITEVALMADRLDITEELVRIDSHLKQVEDIFNNFPIGRKLEFLLQEISREFNTITSKINDANIQKFCVESKAELEKIREQIQNIE